MIRPKPPITDPATEMPYYPAILIGPVGVIADADVLDQRVNRNHPVRTAGGCA
jgi:hypothetical protein